MLPLAPPALTLPPPASILAELEHAHTIAQQSDFIWGFDFRGIRDEVRAVSPGFGIGVVYALASNATFSSGFNPLNVSNTLIYFALFQTCASDGNYPTRPIDRVFV